MNRRLLVSKSVVGIGSAVMLLSAMPSAGQATLEEVVVTATKRGEVALQDVAASVQAIDGDLLRRTGADGLEDYMKLVPGLVPVSSGTGQSQIVLRGVNSARIAHAQPQAQGTVAVYINEIPVTSTGFNPDLNLFDLARVEVLRGPQGTLYGASSMAGAIRLITNQPTPERLEGKISFGGGGTQDGDPEYGLKGLINVPLGERVAVRAVAYGTHAGGFIDNMAAGHAEDNYNAEDTVGGRVSLGYSGERLSLVGTVMYNKLEADGRPDEYVRATRPTLLANLTDERQTIRFVDDPFEDELAIYNLTADYDFAPVHLTSSTTFADRNFHNTLDDTFRIVTLLPVSLAQVPYVAFFNDTDTQSLVHETRLSSKTTGPLRWVAGVYYQDEDKSFDQSTDAPGFDAAVGLRGIPPSSVFGASKPNQVLEAFKDIGTKQKAAFGEVSYDITKQLELTVGLRWFDYEVDVDLRAAGIANRGATRVVDTLKEDGVNKKAKLTYRITDDKLVYLDYAEGFRMGGVGDFIPTGPGGLCAGQQVDASYKSDDLSSIELGAKTSWMDNRLVANAAVYRINWKDIQSTRFLTCGFQFVTNAGRMVNTGLELEFAYQLAEGLTARFGGSYVDTDVKEAVPGFNQEGDEAPYVPNLSVATSLEYGANMFAGFGFVRGDFNYVGGSRSEFSRTSVEVPPYSILDLTLGYEWNDWEMSFYTKNLFDRRVVTNVDPDRNQPPQYSLGRPRTLGVAVTRKF